MSTWDSEIDILEVGSGAGIRIPGSDVAKAAGFDDDLDGAFTYLRALSANNVPDVNIRAYIDNAAPMLRWLVANTPVQYLAFPYPDYHAENPGAVVIGTSRAGSAGRST